MVIFILPLKSRAASENWELVSRLCINSLNSIFRQTSQNYRIILVGNDKPLNCPNHPKLEIITDNFKLPTNYSERFLDQKLKVKRGMIEAKKYGTNYLFRMDADDYIHKNIVSYTEGKNEQGWYIPKGYVYQEGSKVIYLRDNFNYSTATSHIIKVDEKQMPQNMDTPDNEYFVDMWKHLTLKSYFEKIGKPLSPLPFRGAAYTIGHTESVMGHSLNKWNNFRKLVWKFISRRKLTAEIQDNFGFNEINHLHK